MKVAKHRKKDVTTAGTGRCGSFETPRKGRNGAGAGVGLDAADATNRGELFNTPLMGAYLGYFTYAGQRPMAVIYRSSHELRKKPRRPLHHSAKIVTDGKEPPRNCVIADISEDGARLVLDGDDELPEGFILLLSKGGDRRRCRIVWRTGATVGVEFMMGES